MPFLRSLCHEEMSRMDPGFCLAFLAHSMLCANNIAVNANEEQKKRWLPRLCSGEWVGSMAMSEPDAGTDVLSLSTYAKRETEAEPYSITGRKMWITNGAIDDKGTPCDCVLLYVKTKSSNAPSEASSSASSEVSSSASSGNPDDTKKQLSTFVVEKGFKGFSVGQKIYNKTGMRASNTAELVFNECQVSQGKPYWRRRFCSKPHDAQPAN